MRMGTTILAMVLIGLCPARGQFTDCDPVTLNGAFAVDTLASRVAHLLEEPLHLDFDGSAPGAPDVWFIERKGLVRRIRAATGKVETVGRVPVGSFGETGLLGIALDPDFDRTRRVYLTYVPAGKSELRVSRFGMQGDSLDMAGEKVLIRFPSTGAIYHGGAMLFDPAGNLFIAFGNGESDPRQGRQWISADSRDFRGKILRIKPTEDGYSIPAGNLFPLDQYPDSAGAKTRPEVYAMGVKQPFSLGIDPAAGRLLFGEMGPDNGGLDDELNLASGPGNFGWPYFYGDNKPFDVWGTGKDPAHPVNASPLSNGLTDLPPAVPAARPLRQSAPITGSIYRRPLLPGRGALPGAFSGLWFSTDFNNGDIDTARVEASGRLGSSGTLKGIRLSGPLDLRSGPDGAIYAINYAGWYNSTEKTTIVRIRWVEACATGVRAGTRATAPARMGWDGWGTEVPRGPLEVEYRDVTGKLRWGRSGR